jgi:hypothetical protein
MFGIMMDHNRVFYICLEEFWNKTFLSSLAGTEYVCPHYSSEIELSCVPRKCCICYVCKFRQSFIYMHCIFSFNLEADSLEILVLLQSRKIVQSSEVSALITSSMHSDSVILSCVICTLLPSSYYNGFKHLKMSKEGAAGKRKHVTITISQKLEIIRRFKSGESHSVIMAAYNKDFPIST